MTSKHDKLVDLVEKELLERGYSDIYKFVEYRGKKRVYGEIDIYARKGKYVLLFEVKSFNSKRNYKKAIEQTLRAKKYYFNNDDRVFMFYVYGIKHNSYNMRWLV